MKVKIQWSNMTVEKVYGKYRHLDNLLSDKEWLPRNSLGEIIFDLWCAVKATVRNQETNIERREFK